MNLIYSLTLISAFLLMVFTLNLLQKYNLAEGETTRKIGHVVLGAILIVMPNLFCDLFFPVFTTLSITFIIYIASKNNRLACADNVDRHTYGTILFPIGVLITYLFAYLFHRFDLFYISVLILSLSDLAAALMGKLSLKIQCSPFYNINVNCYYKFKKTLSGSIVFMAVTILILTCFRCSILAIIFVSILITILEFIAQKGMDNIYIPVISFMLLYIIE